VIYCNMRALEVANIETIIVARSCVPCVVCVLEFLCLGRQLPGWRSTLAMLVMGATAAGYVLTDKQFEAEGGSVPNSTQLNLTATSLESHMLSNQAMVAAYFWVLLYFIMVSAEMAYGKYIVGPHLGFESMWGPVLYNNTHSIPPMLTIGLLSGEHHKLCEVEWTSELVTLVLVSCVIGVAISYFGFKARFMVSATCFTVLGVANKMVTVAANALIWDQHATPLGIFLLMLCLLAATAYQQSPMRQQQKALIQSEEKLTEQSMQPIEEDARQDQEAEAVHCTKR